MKKLLLTAIIVLFGTFTYAQILITDPDLDTLNPLDCIANSGPTPNFFDSGVNSGNYGSGENEIIVVCPDFAGGTSKLAMTFGINNGLTFDVDASDTVYVYDGLNISAPLLGKHNSITDPFGFNHTASFVNNTSGCLTVQFISDGAVEGTGWDANITCVQNPQPFEPKMQGFLNGTGPDIINPADTGYADICLGDSIMFVATGLYPYSSDITGVGYSQNNTNVSFDWEFSDGSQATGDTVWFKPTGRNGYLALLRMVDAFPQGQSITSKIRVATLPNFSGLLNGNDTICVGDTTRIVGAVTPSDTAGVSATNGNFQLGGIIAGLTPLPDGSGINYTTTVNISGFLPNQTITSVSDIQEFKVTMEHSFLGDLEMLLECPNGTQVSIFNGYSPGIIPGGFGGGNTFLGDAFDQNLGTPGVGWEYIWSTVNATWGDFPTEFAAGNTLPTTISNGNAMNPNGIYLPEESFANFIGCPVNGNWTITVRDNIGTDDGFIFEWGILFDPAINPNSEVYAPSIVSAQWLSAATVLPGNPTDTFIDVTSTVPGDFGYTFQVTDNFGCNFDTTVFVHYLFPPSVPADTVVCDTVFQLAGASLAKGGVWTYTGPGTASFSPDNTAENPQISVDTPGAYVFTLTNVLCGVDSSFQVDFVLPPDVPNDTTVCGMNYQVSGVSAFAGGFWIGSGPGNITFSDDSIENPLISVDMLGTYTLQFVDNQCKSIGFFLMTFVPAPTIPSDTIICDDQYQFLGTTSSSGGVWSVTGPGTANFSPNNSTENPLVTIADKGIYIFTFNDNTCGSATSFQVGFPNIITPFTLPGADFCIGDQVILDATSPFIDASYLWSNGSTFPTITATTSGTYTATVSGLCNSESATSVVVANPCNISAPNVITPNGDGQNDVLIFQGLQQFSGSSLSVYNRWGIEVYQNDNYQNDWSPTDLTDGTYFYILTPSVTGNIEIETVKGNITVLH